jgi:hypothetical protein
VQFIKGGVMKNKELIAGKVFKGIGSVVSTVESIHGDIAEIKGEKSEREKVYGMIKSINGRLEETVLDLLKLSAASR